MGSASPTIATVPVNSNGAVKTESKAPVLTLEQATKLATELQSKLDAVTFNPFAVLTITEIVALTGRYNKAWRTAHSADIALAQAEYSCSDSEACFYADLKSSAIAIIDRDTISTVGDKLAGLVRGIGTPSKEITLHLIKNDFDALKPELRNEVGKRVRDITNRTYESNTATALLNILYSHLGVREKDWMR